MADGTGKARAVGQTRPDCGSEMGLGGPFLLVGRAGGPHGHSQ